jgi:hypothetical protein
LTKITNMTPTEMATTADHRGKTNLFREEALDAFQEPDAEGVPLRISPQWSRRTYWSLLATMGAGLVSGAAVSVADYAEGPAVVRVDRRIDLTTSSGGIIRAINVDQGDHVTAGQALVQPHAEAELQELERATRPGYVVHSKPPRYRDRASTQYRSKSGHDSGDGRRETRRNG